MVGLTEQLTGCFHECVGLGLQVTKAALFDFGCVLGESSKEGIDLLAHFGCRAKADVGSYVFADPFLDGFVRVEIRAVARQCDQTQSQLRRCQVFSDLRLVMCWPIVPDHEQRPRILRTQLLQESHRSPGIGVAHQDRHCLQLACLQVDRRVVGSLLAKLGAARGNQSWFTAQHLFGAPFNVGAEARSVHKEYFGADLFRFSAQGYIILCKRSLFLRVRLQQLFLRPLDDKAQAMQIVVAIAPAQESIKTVLGKLTHNLPVPVRHLDTYRGRCTLYRRLQFRLLRWVEGGGDYRSADQPRANNQIACQRSRSRAVGAPYIHSCTALTSNCQFPSVTSMSFIVETSYISGVPSSIPPHSAGFTLESV